MEKYNTSLYCNPSLCLADKVVEERREQVKEKEAQRLQRKQEEEGWNRQALLNQQKAEEQIWREQEEQRLKRERLRRDLDRL